MSKTTSKKKTTTIRKSGRLVKLLYASTYFGRTIEKNWKYSNKNSKTSWAAAKKNKIINCARYMSFCLQYAGILKSGEVIYYTTGLKGNGVNKIKKSKLITRIYPKKVAKKCKLKEGDIC